MLAVCGSCLSTLSKLRESVSGLRADLMERDKILMDFSTVAATQAKLITYLKRVMRLNSTQAEGTLVSGAQGRGLVHLLLLRICHWITGLTS